MFTGLVEAQGTLVAVAEAAGGRPRRLTFAWKPEGDAAQAAADAGGDARPMRLGDSVAVDGCCLTVVHFDAQHLSFEAATETLARTTLGQLQVGARVNLERALRLGDRLGGHCVSGHVDGVGTLLRRQPKDSAVYFEISAPQQVARLTAARGSITVAGVSLTVTAVTDQTFSVGLIPHTLAHTTLGDLQPGAQVNLEADLLARYVERLMAHPRGRS